MVDCLRVGFDHKLKKDYLVGFEHDPLSGNVILRENYYFRYQVHLYIGPTVFDLVCHDYSSQTNN